MEEKDKLQPIDREWTEPVIGYDEQIVKPNPLTPEEIEEMRRMAHQKSKESGPDINTDLMIQNIDWRIGQRFDAHGITKIGIPNHLTQLLSLLDNGIDPNRDFHTAQLEINPENKAGAGVGLGTAGGTASKDGSFVIMGEIDRSLRESGIKYVIVNDAYYEAVQRLSEAYPGVRFIRATELNQELKNIADSSSS